ncbi:MAG TPA: aminotransferase class I/II-fold pyridoxal phosphate-dependent enzyme [Actinomycetota bacterium]|nr:aminotransferase class I/II-fold pyridoxal phosphate-dependent enzyme [Actinomycetota bacterium]
MTEREPGFQTRAVHGAALPPVDQRTPSVPIYQTSTFRFEDSEAYAETIAFRRPGYTYTRGYGNPTLDAFEGLVASLEETPAAMSFSSGMAAVHTLWTSHVRAGDRIVATNALYGGAFALATKMLPRFGVTVDLIDGRDLDRIAEALPGAALFYTETIANPTMAVADLEALGALCRAAGVPAAVDNTFASPALCVPARHGFAYALHSTTKYLGGHHDHTGGVIACGDEGRTRLRDTVIDTGGTMAPFEAWLAMRGIITLGLRMRRHSDSAAFLAERLQEHPRIERVFYPGLASHPDAGVAARILPDGCGGMLAVEVAGGMEAGAAFCDALRLAWVATSLGGSHTLVGHAASTTHRQYAPEARRAAGITDGLVRISVGLEDPEDLLDDMVRALEAA